MSAMGTRVIIYDDEAGYYRVHNLNLVSSNLVAPQPRPVAMAVYIDAACRNEGGRNAIASYGVYFGPDSAFNQSGLVAENKPQTTIRAEIEALWKALKAIDQESTRLFGRENEVVILTASSFLHSAITKWLAEWRDNDGRNSQGVPVSYFRKWVAIDDLWDDLVESGMMIKIRRIRRSDNRGAEGLANAVLDEEEPVTSQALGKPNPLFVFNCLAMVEFGSGRESQNT